MLNSYNDERDLDLLVRIGEMYYIQGKTQKDISEALGLSRSGVSRLLQAARDQGIVHITVKNPSERLQKLGQGLSEAFGLTECIVCPSEEDHGAGQLRLAYQAAELLLSCLKPGDILGLGLSTAVHSMVELLPNSSEYPCLKVVPISGGTGEARGPHINYTVQLAAQKLRADYVSLNVPLFIDEPTIVARLLEEESVKQCTSLWSQLSCAVVGIGVTSNNTVPDGLRMPVLHPHAATAAAVCGWFFDEEGQPIKGKSTTSISIEQLQKTPAVMAVAGGRHKASAVLSVLRAGFITQLVTDEDVARRVLHLNQ